MAGSATMKISLHYYCDLNNINIFTFYFKRKGCIEVMVNYLWVIVFKKFKYYFRSRGFDDTRNSYCKTVLLLKSC